ncbi:MAG: hypothetical protein V7788_00840 [Alphaproteobacteria bacterium]
MSNTQDIYTELGDEALDAPVQHAFASAACAICVVPYVSDEPLDPAPAQEAAACAICVYPCYVSDEALDPAPAQEAAVCICGACR